MRGVRVVQPLTDAPTPPDPAELDRHAPGHGRLAQAPWAIPPLGWRDILWRTYQEVGRDHLQSVAGSVTFYVLLAMIPALGVFVSLYGLIADVRAVEEQLAQLALVMPADGVRLVGREMLRLATERPANLSAAFAGSLLLSVWSANAAMKSLFEGLNATYGEVEKRNYFSRTALTYTFTGCFLLFVTLVAAILVATPIALSALRLRSDLLIGLRWVMLFAVAAATFAVAFRYGPCRRRARWRWIAPGAGSAALLWLGGSAGFSWYVNNIAHVQLTYGSLGAAMGFLLWLYWSVLIVLIGAEFSAEIEHQTALDTTVGPDRALGARGAAMADTVGKPFGGVRQGVGQLWGASRRVTRRLVRPTRPQAPPAGPPGPPRSTDR